jgi:serine protease Do
MKRHFPPRDCLIQGRDRTKLTTMHRRISSAGGRFAKASITFATATAFSALTFASAVFAQAANTSTSANAGQSTQAAQSTQSSVSSATSNGATTETRLPPPSPTGQRLFDAARDKLVQIRILTRAGSSQASVGSGFLIAPDGTTLTNYHVISQLVLEPLRFRAEYVRVDGKRGEVALVGFDVIHDLALVRLEGITNAAHFNLREANDPLRQGEKVFSLGNPLDLGFAISEGTYNGLVERRLYEQIHFTGALNPGMSGGPAVDEQGRVIGVNVAGTGGELANLLVPLTYVRPLLATARDTQPDKKLIAMQLQRHQTTMIDALLAKPLPRQTLGPAEVAVGDDKLLRCWGNSNAKPDKVYRTETINCALRSSLYLDSSFTTGTVKWDHTYRTGEKLGAFRFASWQQRSMTSATMLSGLQEKPTRYLTRPHCHEDFVKGENITFRAAICVRAHREFEGLFDMNVTATSVDRKVDGLTSSLQATGVTFANGNRLLKSFLEASKWK